MYLIFMDESGYTSNWKEDWKSQPYYVCSAVCIQADKYPNACDCLRKEFKDSQISTRRKLIGEGYEIKASDIGRGTGWWAHHDKERNIVRETMLKFPKVNDGVAFIVVVDKKAHLDKYSDPADPPALSFTFIFERLQKYLERQSDYGICIYDQSKYGQSLQEHSVSLKTEGSLIFHWSGLGMQTLKTSRVLELCLGESRNSVGLQVADFFATLAYYYHKEGCPPKCGWWETLKSSLDEWGDNIEGVGYKRFPEKSRMAKLKVSKKNK